VVGVAPDVVGSGKRYGTDEVGMHVALLSVESTPSRMD
jgi:hypothetical protein